MKKLRKNNIKINNGITLISLVITIIILLILVGITISSIAGNNGIINKTKQAKEKNLIETEKEQVFNVYATSKINLVNTSRNKITDYDVEEELLKSKNDINTTSNQTNEGYIIYVTFNETDHTYKIKEDGNIEYIEKEKEDTSKIDEKLVVQNIDTKDSLYTIKNPDRGFYKPFGMTLNSTGFNQANIQDICNNAIKNNMQILHLRVDIGQLSGNKNDDGIDKNFTEEQISILNDTLNTIRKNKLNVIIRFSYDTKGETGKEPKSFSSIQKHIQQLSQVFEKNKDVISTVEAGFLGPWGEMHSAKAYQSDNYYKELIETLLKNTPSEMKINVRVPHFFKIVVGELNDTQHRIGIFNDGYLGSSSDLGTFTQEISRETFVNWMQTQGRYTLYGGEATKFSNASADDEKYSESSFALSEMPKTHTSYLNSEFNTKILNDKWANQTYTNENSEYNGKTAYKYIADHLGYRLVVRNSKISSSVKKGEICGVNIGIENVGFGDIVRKQKASVILKKDSTYYETNLDINANSIKSGETSNFNFYFYTPSDIEEGDWEVYLKIANANNSDYGIQFANSNMWDEKIFANKIGKITIENSVAEKDRKMEQAFSAISTEGKKGTVKQEVKTIPVEFDFYENSTRLKYFTKNIQLGTTINFKDSESLEKLEIEMPNGYIFINAQCYAINNNWNGYNSITIPEETDKSNYIINVFVKKDDGKISATLGFFTGNTEITTLVCKFDPGTTINFKDPENLASLGITIPDGYTFDCAQCKDITGDWNGYNSITIPDKKGSSYWINVFLKAKQ